MEFSDQIFSDENLRHIEEKSSAQIICNKKSENKIYTELQLYQNKTDSTIFEDEKHELDLESKDRQSSSRINILDSQMSAEYSEEDSEEIDPTSASGSGQETEVHTEGAT